MSQVAEFVSEEEDTEEAPLVTSAPPVAEEQDEPSQVTPARRNARIKGTWTMFWGEHKYDFVDGRRYDVPNDLFQYLKNRECVYDTMG